MNILLEDKNIIAVYKPAGLATQTASFSQKDLVSEVKNYLAGTQQQKNPYLAVINRLDQPVEGIVLFAKDEKSAGQLSAQLQENRIKKHYYAAICGQMEQEKGQLVDYLCKDGKQNTSRVVLQNPPYSKGSNPLKDTLQGAKKAVLDYQVLKTWEGFQLLQIELQTGRHHQIRVQFASREHPLLGDSKYGTEKSRALSEKMNCRKIALCACKLVFLHPVTGKKTELTVTSQNPIFIQPGGRDID